MKPELVFSFLRISVKVLLIFLIVITSLVFVSSVLTLSGMHHGFGEPGFSYDVRKFGDKATPAVTMTADSLIRYLPVTDHYKLQIEPHSALGYYSSVSRLIFLGFGIAILYLFSKIFSEVRLKDSFTHNIYRKLVLLASLFAVSDIFKFIDYFIFNKLMHKSVQKEHFELLTDMGDGLITGLVIYAIAIIYRRGLSLANENALTI